MEKWLRDLLAFLESLSHSAPPAAPAFTPAAPTVANGANAVITDMVSHETGGKLTYAGALAVLQDVAKAGISASEFALLQAAAKDLNVSGGVSAAVSVQQLLDNVALGNTANAYWNGGSNTAQRLGNLSASSTTAQLNELIGKWFLGTDLPGVSPAPGQTGQATAYVNYTLPLFTSAGPAITDVNQGQLGDCWFLAALGETALEDPTLIKNMITSNGNGTYTVDFHVNGQDDYVTVNSALSTYTGKIGQFDGSKMEFANSTSSLWVPLVEKGLAQLAEEGVVTGLDYAAGQNQYFELTGGLGEGISLVTGQQTQSYGLGGLSSSSLTSLLGTVQTDISAHEDILLGTSNASAAGNLVADHMFAVTGVNAAAGTLTLYNPWGANSVGAGIAESFTISASTLVTDQATIFAASGQAAAA